MAQKFKRPRDKKELEQLEADGLWKAISLSNKIGDGTEKITLEVILRIHRVMFSLVTPEIAGRFRISGEDIKKLTYIEPPPGRLVQGRMYEFARELDLKVSKLPSHISVNTLKKRKERLNAIFGLAVWVQYQITSIHPFCEGNGRMSRLLTNVILKRYSVPPSQVRFEGENKKEYLSALGQIDRYQDYEPLKRIIVASAIEHLKKEEKVRKSKSNQ
jgi:fido (protein-threonine AMPylation protein)